MQVVVAFLLIGSVVALLGWGVVAYFNSGSHGQRSDAKRLRRELADANERVSIGQTALIEIASGDAMPVLRASEALAQITKSYQKEITQ